MLATLSTTRSNTLRGAGDSVNASLLGGYHLAFTVGAVLILVAVGLAAVVLKSQPLALAEPAPVELAEAGLRRGGGMNMWLLFRMPGDGTGAPAPVKVVAVKRLAQ